MTGPMPGRTEVSDHLSRICGISALGLLLLIIMLVILERVGAAKELPGYLLVPGALALYAGIGVISRTANLSDYQVAGRRNLGGLRRRCCRRGVDLRGRRPGRGRLAAAGRPRWPLPADRIDRRIHPAGGSDRTVPAQPRRPHGARFHGRKVWRLGRFPRGDRARGLLIDLRGRADPRRDPPCRARARAQQRRCARYHHRGDPAVRASRRHARRYRHPGRAIRRADHRLPCPVSHLRGAKVRHSGRTHLRPGDRGARSDAARLGVGADAQPAQRSLSRARCSQ